MSAGLGRLWPAACGPCVGQFFFTGLHPIAGWRWRSAALFVIGLLIMAPAAVGLWLATGSLIRLRQDIAATPTPLEGQLHWDARQVDMVTWLTSLRTLVQRLLATLSAAVSAVTLSTGMLRAALLALPHPRQPISYPASAPLLLGLLFSILVALSYLPAAVNLQDACDAVQTGTAILAPLLASLSAVLVK